MVCNVWMPANRGIQMGKPKKIEKVNLATCAADGKKRMIMEFIWNIQASYISGTLIILLLRKKWKSTKTYCLPIAKLSETSMESVLGKYLRLFQLWAKKRSMSCIAETCNYICLWDWNWRKYTAFWSLISHHGWNSILISIRKNEWMLRILLRKTFSNLWTIVCSGKHNKESWWKACYGSKEIIRISIQADVC